MNDYQISSGSGISINVQNDSPLSSDHFVNSPQSVYSNSSQSLYSSSPNSQDSTQGLHDLGHYPQVPNVGQNHLNPYYVEGSPAEQNYLNYTENIQQQQIQQQVQHYVDQQPFHNKGKIDTGKQQLHNQQVGNFIYQPHQNPTRQLQYHILAQNVQLNSSVHNSQDSLSKLVWKIQPTKTFRYRYLTEKGGHGFLSGEIKNSCPTIELQNYNGNVEFRVHLYTREISSTEPHSILRILQESDVRQNRQEIKEILKEEVIFNGSNSYQSITCELRGISIIKLTKEDLQRLGKDLEEAANLVKKYNKSSVCLQVEAWNPNTRCRIAPPIFSRCINNERGACGKLRIIRRSIYTCPVEGNEELWILSDPVKKNDIEVIISDGYGWKKKCNNLEIFHQHVIICRIPPFDKERITEPSLMQLLLYRPSDDTWSDSQEIKYLPSQSDCYKRKRPNIEYQELFSSSNQQYHTKSQTQPGPPSPLIAQEWIMSPNYGPNSSVQSGEELQFNIFDMLKPTSTNDLTTDGTGTEIRTATENDTKLTINEYDSQGFTSLHVAIFNGMNKEVLYLLYCGASVNLPAKLTGDIPLIIAVKFDHKQIIQALLDVEGIELHVKNWAGETAIDFLENGSEAIKIFHSHEKTKHLKLPPIQHDKNANSTIEGTSKHESLDVSDRQITLVNEYENITDIDLYKEDSETINPIEILNDYKNINDMNHHTKDSEAINPTEILNEKSPDYKIHKDSSNDMDDSNLGVPSIHFYFYCFFPVFLAYYFWVIYYNN